MYLFEKHFSVRKCCDKIVLSVWGDYTFNNKCLVKQGQSQRLNNSNHMQKSKLHLAKPLYSVRKIYGGKKQNNNQKYSNNQKSGKT